MNESPKDALSPSDAREIDGIARALLGPEFAKLQAKGAEWDAKADALEMKLRDRLAKLRAAHPEIKI